MKYLKSILFSISLMLFLSIVPAFSESEYAPIKFDELAAGYRITIQNEDYTEVVCYKSTSALETGEFWDNLEETTYFTYDSFSDIWQLSITEEKGENFNYVVMADEVILLELGDVRYY